MNNFFLKLKQVIKLSRPRFWFYTAGTFLVGFVFGVDSLNQFDIKFAMWFLYFLIPANLLIYGINDLADEKIDILNAKKAGKEIVVDSSNRILVKYAFGFSLLVSAVFLFFVEDRVGLLLLVLFILLGIFYSLPPIRFKTKVFLDFISNGFYILPGIFGFYLTAGSIPGWVYIIAALFWAFSMHLFSAVVDIEADRKANIQTSATFLGFKFGLVLCSVFWLVSWVLVFNAGILENLIYLYLIYPILPMFIIFKKITNLSKIYWYYPVINIILGFLLFLQALKSIL